MYQIGSSNLKSLEVNKTNQIYLPRTILPLTYFIHLPMKMEPIVSSETSAIRTQTPGNYPKRNKLHLEHGESLKIRRQNMYLVKVYSFSHVFCMKNPKKTKEK